jgi:quercetin dioxygenase-like cupin family protein
MIGLGSDCGFLIRGLHTMLATAGRDRKMDASLTPRGEVAEAATLARPPESFRPDRMEVMNDFGRGNKIEIQPGVLFEALVGAHNGAKDLTTGIVRFAPGVKLAYHTHPTTESIVLLKGRQSWTSRAALPALPLDNVVIPPGVPHVLKTFRRNAKRCSTLPSHRNARGFSGPLSKATNAG